MPVNNTDLQDKYLGYVEQTLRAELLPDGVYREISAPDATAGAVKVPVRALDPTTKQYDRLTGAPLTQNKTTYDTIVIDEDVAVNELLDGYVSEALSYNVVAQTMGEVGYAIGKTMDTSGILKLETNSQTNPSTTVLDNTDAFQTIIADMALLRQKGVNRTTMRLIISPRLEGTLLNDDKFVRQSNIGSQQVMEGLPMTINGVPIYVSNNMLTANAPGETGTEFILTNNIWTYRLRSWMVTPRVATINDATHVGASKVEARAVFTYHVARPLFQDIATDTVIKKQFILAP